MLLFFQFVNTHQRTRPARKPTYELDAALRVWLQNKMKREDRNRSGVARAVGVSAPRFYWWLTGHNRIPLNKLNQLARYFGYADEAAMLADVRRLYPAR